MEVTLKIEVMDGKLFERDDIKEVKEMCVDSK